VTIRSDGNRLIFSGKVGDDFFPASAALHNMITKQGYQDIVLDFSKVAFLEPKFMLPVVTMARSYRSSEVDFEIIEPEEKAIANLLLNANWAHIVVPEKYESREQFNKSHLSAILYRDADEQFAAVDRSMDVILQHLEGIDRSRFKALEWALNEITDNVLNHAESRIGGIVQVTAYPKKHIVELYVCDAGIGIPRSLRSGKTSFSDDVSALRAAIEEGVTRNQSTNQGNGLFGTFKCCEVSEGEFDVSTGNVVLRARPGHLHVGRSAIPFNGTFIRAAINYSFEGLLEKALVFKGKQHTPEGDYIDRMYQLSGEIIELKVAKEFESFGSRQAGKAARTKIENLMDRARRVVAFDFEGVHLISSSFADEVFGKLFVDLGAIRFTELCKFSNVDPTVRRLIDRAVAQRVR
jgi:anti-sigma regulatory factor (Ser/Thr protein kinase)